MTPEEMRIEIAKACGWHHITSDLVGCCPDCGGFSNHDLIPDYLNDRNAIADAEKVLSLDQKQAYYELLSRAPWNATDSQRAEAFLRTLGLWKE